MVDALISIQGLWKVVISQGYIQCVPIKFGLYLHFIKIPKLKFNCFVFVISE